MPELEIEIHRPDVPMRILRAVTNTYPDTVVLDDSRIVGKADVPGEVIESDLNFWLDNQTIPAENVCSRLDNYQPKNPSQERLMAAAKFLINEGLEQRAMGLFAHGDPGLGKTHISVGIAKEVAGREQGRLTYINASTTPRLPNMPKQYAELADEGRGVIILDDVNSAYGMSADALRGAISGVHDVGGRLFVTSNAPDAEGFLATALRAPEDKDGIEFQRLQDRVRGMLHVVRLEGDSHRLTTAQNPWLTFNPGEAEASE